MIQNQFAPREIGTIGQNVTMTWAHWLRTGGNMVVTDLSRLLYALVHIQDRINQRRELSQLDDRMLADIGITRSQALKEASKPFWK